MTIITEGGLRPSRIEYVEEPEQGVTPADPAWSMPSERVTTFTPGLTQEYSEDSGLGEIDYERHVVADETELEMEYALQQWFTDADGAPQDMAAYGMERVANLLPSSLTVVRRMDSGDQEGANAPVLRASSTVDARYNPDSANNGADSTRKAARTYVVLKGVDVGEGTLTGERGESAWMAELTCPAEHGRTYQVDQPTESTQLVVYSEDTSDTGLTVTIEDEDGNTSEEVSLDADDATVPVSTTSSFDNIDSIEVRDTNGDVIDGDDGRDYSGNIVVAKNTADETAPSEGEWLAYFYGSDEYGNTYGDPGIPSLGAGSHASAISPAGEDPEYYRPANLGVQRPTGEFLQAAGGVQSVEIEFGSDVSREQGDGREQIQHHGMRSLESTITANGETITSYMQRESATGTGQDTRYVFNRDATEYVDFVNAVITETGAEDSAGENATEREYTVMARRGPDGGSAINISPAAE